MSIKVIGIYDRTIYRDKKSASTIFALRTKEYMVEQNRYGNIICIGKIINYEKGMPLFVEGEWQDSKEYGPQLQISHIKEYSWDEAAAIEYLVAGKFSGVGYSVARELISKMGANIFNFVLEPGAAMLISKRVRSISKENAAILCEKIKGTIHQRELFEFLLYHGGSWLVAEKLFKSYSINALSQLKQTPYATGMDYGLDFYSCDRIGKEQGRHPANIERLTAAVKAAMKRIRSEGHTFAFHNEICRAVHTLLKSSSYQEEIPTSLIESTMIKSDDIIIEKGLQNRIYLKYLHEAEINAAKHIGRIMKSKKILNFEESLISNAENKCGLRYLNQQRKTFELLHSSGIGIITGGPGTGKTSCVAGLLAAYTEMYPNAVVRLCAPTGRASQRLAESTGMEAVTIHRLLEYRPYGDKITHKDLDNPLDADLLIVDEGSMLSIGMASILFSAVRSGTLILIIGDVNQLPAVEPGDVLHDLICSCRIPVYQLRDVHRQAADSPIIKNSDLINDGFTELIEDERFEIHYSDTQNDVANTVISAVKALYNPKTPFSTQVLSPVYNGDAGVVILNNRLQELLNPSRGEKELQYGEHTFRRNDKVILLSNNYNAQYFNGDIGMISEIGDSSITVQLGQRQICLTIDMMEQIDLAYCISIHKSQGSEFSNGILSLPNIRNLTRNLLYTGITRAKDRVVLASQSGAIYTAIQTSNFGMRNSRLIERIQEELIA